MQANNTNKPAFGSLIAGGNANPLANASAKPAKPATGKAAKPANKPATDKPASPPVEINARDGYLARRADTIDAMRYPYAETSGRDESYSAFYALACDEHGTGPDKRTVSLASLASYGKRNPLSSSPSAPATDAGAAERFAKRGFGTFDKAARSLTVNAAGYADGSAILAKLRKPAPAKA